MKNGAERTESIIEQERNTTPEGYAQQNRIGGKNLSKTPYSQTDQNRIQNRTDEDGHKYMVFANSLFEDKRILSTDSDNQPSAGCKTFYGGIKWVGIIVIGETLYVATNIHNFGLEVNMMLVVTVH